MKRTFKVMAFMMVVVMVVMMFCSCGEKPVTFTKHEAIEIATNYLYEHEECMSIEYYTRHYANTYVMTINQPNGDFYEYVFEYFGDELEGCHCLVYFEDIDDGFYRYLGKSELPECVTTVADLEELCW